MGGQYVTFAEPLSDGDLAFAHRQDKTTVADVLRESKLVAGERMITGSETSPRRGM